MFCHTVRNFRKRFPLAYGPGLSPGPTDFLKSAGNVTKIVDSESNLSFRDTVRTTTQLLHRHRNWGRVDKTEVQALSSHNPLSRRKFKVMFYYN